MLFTLLISALAVAPASATAPASHSPTRAYDDPSTWKRIEFDRSKDLVTVLEEYPRGLSSRMAEFSGGRSLPNRPPLCYHDPLSRQCAAMKREEGS